MPPLCARAPAVSLAFPQQGGLPRDQARPVPAPLTPWCSHRPPLSPEGWHPSACPGALAQHQCAVNPCAGNAGRDRRLQRGVLRPQSEGLSCPSVAQTPQRLPVSPGETHTHTPGYTHTHQPTRNAHLLPGILCPLPWACLWGSPPPPPADPAHLSAGLAAASSLEAQPFCPNQSPRSGPSCGGSRPHSDQLSESIRAQLSLGPSGS